MTRKALIDKIKALLSKTVANGCTEAEAMSALEKARQMMAAHEVDPADIAAGGEECVRESRTVPDRDRIRERLATAVGEFCGCRAWKGPQFEAVSFFGFEGDALFAHWLLDMLADFVARELAHYLERTWKPGTPRVRRVESNGFVAGCTQRIALRLIELTNPDKTRNAIVEREMKSAGVALRDGNSSFRRVDGRAHEAGLRAGDGAQFNRPVGDAPMRLLS